MIVITTPTGLIGHQVLENLLDRGEALRVIARDSSCLPAGARERVKVVEGSHGDPDVVDEAFAGADAVFWLAPPDPRAESVEAAFLDFTRAAADAFKRHAVRRVVGITALGRGTPWAAHAGYVTGSLAMDDLIASTGVSYRALTNPSFMDNILRQASAIKGQGMFVSPISGDRRLPTVATRDIAAVAARLLLDERWSGVEEVPLLGPEDLSFNDLAEIMSEVLGKAVRFQQIPFEAYKARFVEFGMSEAMAQGMTDMAAAKNQGLDNAVRRTPENSTPTSFASGAKRYSSQLSPVSRSRAGSLPGRGRARCGALPTISACSGGDALASWPVVARSVAKVDQLVSDGLDAEGVEAVGGRARSCVICPRPGRPAGSLSAPGRQPPVLRWCWRGR
jgi:uncharacterized protein YbjT (DUF2867 family)